MIWQVPLSDIDLDDQEILAVTQVLRSRWLSQGEMTREFEEQFASYLGVKHAIAVANGTAALHLACAAIGLTAENQVILPSLTFVATANAVRYVQAEPVFADITSLNDLTISPAEIEKKITPSTKALIVMHYGGFICDIEPILEITRRHSLFLIEDAAHAPGSELKGTKAGTFGDLGCFSFFANKNLVTGEGGMVVTNQDELAQKIRLLRSHGMTSMTWDRHQGHSSSYDVIALGYNYRLDEIRASIGLVQLAKLENNNHRRQEIRRIYENAFSGNPNIQIPFYHQSRGISSNHLFPILLIDAHLRPDFINYLRLSGVQSSIHYPPIHKFNYYTTQAHSQYIGLDLTEKVGKSLVTLPLFATMTNKQIETVIEAVNSFF